MVVCPVCIDQSSWIKFQLPKAFSYMLNTYNLQLQSFSDKYKKVEDAMDNQTKQINVWALSAVFIRTQTNLVYRKNL